jgi:hypothetical protein
MRTASTIKAMMMESVYSSETSVSFNYTTQRYIPEDCDVYVTLIRIRCKVRTEVFTMMNMSAL